jgi:hypothetical protein
MNLLHKKHPIVINPTLAVRVGLNEAIALQQLAYWIEETKSGVDHQGMRWVYNTHSEWKEQFPFWSVDTIKRTFLSLHKQGVIFIEQLNKSKHDRTNFYTVNYESVCLIDEGKLPPSMRAICPVLHTEITTENSTLSPKGGLAGEIREEEIISAWNKVAKKRNFKATRGIPTKVVKYLKANYSTYLKQCKKDCKPVEETQALTEFTCSYLEYGFPEWAGPHYSGQNDRQWRADLEFATRTTTFEKIFFDAE